MTSVWTFQTEKNVLSKRNYTNSQHVSNDLSTIGLWGEDPCCRRFIDLSNERFSFYAFVVLSFSFASASSNSNLKSFNFSASSSFRLIFVCFIFTFHFSNLFSVIIYNIQNRLEEKLLLFSFWFIKKIYKRKTNIYFVHILSWIIRCVTNEGAAVKECVRVSEWAAISFGVLLFTLLKLS